MLSDANVYRRMGIHRYLDTNVVNPPPFPIRRFIDKYIKIVRKKDFDRKRFLKNVTNLNEVPKFFNDTDSTEEEFLEYMKGVWRKRANKHN